MSFKRKERCFCWWMFLMGAVLQRCSVQGRVSNCSGLRNTARIWNMINMRPTGHQAWLAALYAVILFPRVSPIAVRAWSKYRLPARTLLQSDGMSHTSAPCWQHDQVRPQQRLFSSSSSALTGAGNITAISRWQLAVCGSCIWRPPLVVFAGYQQGSHFLSAAALALLALPPPPTPPWLCVCDCVSHCASPHSERFHLIAQPASHGRYWNLPP